jgi:hypothetical protein
MSTLTKTYVVAAGQTVGIPERTRTVNTYDNFTGSWLVGLARSSAVTSSTPQSETFTRTIEYDYDATTGLLGATRIEPQSAGRSDAESVSLFRETVFERDLYGSIVAVRQRASGEMRTDLAMPDCHHCRRLQPAGFLLRPR